MDIKSINYKKPSEIVRYKDVVFRSLLEGLRPTGCFEQRSGGDCLNV